MFWATGRRIRLRTGAVAEEKKQKERSQNCNVAAGDSPAPNWPATRG